MTLLTFRRKMFDVQPTGLRWRHKRTQEAVDACIAEFNPNETVERMCERIEQKYGFPWMLLVSVLVELLRWWLENRKAEDRQAFKGWQREMKTINERA